MNSELMGPDYINFYSRSYDNSMVAWRKITANMKVKNIYDLCNSYDHNSVLEIGAGDGAVLVRLSEIKFGTDYYALEVTQQEVNQITRKNIPNLREAYVFDGYHVPYEDKKFDLCILTHVIEHVEFPRLLLYDAIRVSKRVFIEVPLEHTLFLESNYTPDSAGHINYYDAKTIRSLLQTSNLEVLQQVIRNPSLESYLFRNKKTGYAKYLIKKALLQVIPTIAQLIWTYNSSLLCEKSDQLLFKGQE